MRIARVAPACTVGTASLGSRRWQRMTWWRSRIILTAPTTMVPSAVQSQPLLRDHGR